MYAKLFIVLAMAMVAMGEIKYPPGVHPAVCPNYPICDARTLITHTLDGHPIPEWYYNPGVLPVAPYDPQNPTAPRLPSGFNPIYYPYPFIPLDNKGKILLPPMFTVPAAKK